jgi:secreted PhoX family phosphatase
VKDENKVSNDSGNRPFQDVLRVSLDRRRLLRGGVGIATTSMFGALAGSAEASGWDWGKGWWSGPLLGFRPVTLAQGGGTEPAVSPDYEYDVILPWGDPIEPGGPKFKLPVDSQDQTLQIGIGHDGMWFFPIIDDYRDRFGWDDDYDPDPWRGPRLGGLNNDHGVLCINFEFGTNYHVLRKDVPESLEEVRVSQHAHGVGVIELKRTHGRYGKWETVRGHLARRIHVNSPVAFSGPAAGHPLLENANGNVPLGTANNCAFGFTPWGTYLTCEENFNGYFGTEDPSWAPTDAQRRYGFTSSGFAYHWHLFDRRFDLADADYANEHNRFGWIVEIDPFDPTQIPVKRTALGRRKTEGATTHVADDGRVVVYIGDDESFDYVYKFVSAEDWRQMRRNGESPLDRGTLYVARFHDDNTGEWLPLTLDNPALAAEFGDLGALLVNTRRAGDIVGATPLDRPEWTTVAPNGDVYLALTNNSARTNVGDRLVNGRNVDSGPNGPNPIAGAGGNADGHIIRWTEIHGHSGTRFEWDIFVLARDTHGTEESFADPDGIWADPDGRLFIETDGGQKDGLNNQLLVADTRTGTIKRLFTGVLDCEITGLTVTPDRRTMFVNVQHPGDGNPSRSNFPARTDGVTIPRDATVVIRRKDGGIIGS